MKKIKHLVFSNPALACMLIYFISLVAFSWAYYNMFRSDNQCFWINSEVTATKAIERKASLQNIIKDSKSRIDLSDRNLQILAILRDYLKSASGEIEVRSTQTHPGGYFKIETGGYTYILRPFNIVRAGTFISLHVSNNEREIGLFTLSGDKGKFPETYQDYREQVERLKTAEDAFRSEAVKNEQHAQHEINAIASNINQSWQYLDFLYFSTMTQTTVGYGDILPNSTNVRTLVTVQSWLGIILVAFMVAICTQFNRKVARKALLHKKVKAHRYKEHRKKADN